MAFSPINWAHGPSIRLVLVVQAIALGLLAISHSFLALALLAVILGSFPPGIVPLALARVHELVPEHHRQQIAWSRATVSFATFQALAGFAYSALFNATRRSSRVVVRDCRWRDCRGAVAGASHEMAAHPRLSRAAVQIEGNHCLRRHAPILHTL